jgi:NADPH2:quinone reductase
MISRFGGPDVLEFLDVPDLRPEAGEVLVRAHSFGVGRPDSLMRRGIYQWMPPLPFNPGNCAAGEIEEIGDDVQTLRVSQRVLISSRDLPQRGGCYKELITVPADAVHLLPDTVRYDDAVCLPNYEVAWAILHQMVGPRTPKTALIMGAAGGVGGALVQLAKRAGLEVFAVVSSEEKAHFAISMGADYVIDRTQDELRTKIMERTFGEGVDLIIDHAGGPALALYPGLLANWGTLVSYGALAGEPTEDVFAALRRNVGKSPSIRCFSMHSYDKDVVGRRRITTLLIELLARNEIRPAIAQRLALKDVRSAHGLLDAGSACGRIIMHP